MRGKIIMSIRKRFSVLLLAMLLLASSCGGGTTTDTTAADTEDTTEAIVEEAYNFSGHDFGGKKLRSCRQKTAPRSTTISTRKR